MNSAPVFAAAVVVYFSWLGSPSPITGKEHYDKQA
jgi:hypothetical protein